VTKPCKIQTDNAKQVTGNLTHLVHKIHVRTKWHEPLNTGLNVKKIHSMTQKL